MEDNKVNNTSDNSQQIESVNTKRKFSISNLPAVPVIGVVTGLILIVLIIGFISFINKPNPQIVELVNNGNAAIKKSDFKKAQEEFKKALDIENNNAAAQTGLINSYSLEGNQNGIEQKQLDQSKPVIEQSLKSHPDDGEILMAAGYAYEIAGDYNKANDYFKKATEKLPNSSEAWFHLGHVNQFLGNNSDANKFYDKSYALDPKNPLVNMIRGNTFFSEQKLDDSYNSFKTAANNNNISNSVKAEALTGAAIALMNRDDFAYITQAQAIAKQAVETDPTYSPGLGLYGSILYLRNRDNEAITYLKRATEVNPKIAKNYYYLGMLYATQKNYSLAINNLNSAILVIDSDNTIFTTTAKKYNKSLYYFSLSKILYLSDSPKDQVLEMLQKTIELNPQFKNRIKIESENSDIFKTISGTAEFQKLIK